jgi:hypothetical protein
MSFFRSFLLLSFVTLSAAFGLFVIGSRMDSGASGGYAIIETDVSVDDRMLRELLSAGNDNFAGSPVSESSQWVMLDSFGSVEMIPLDKYSSRIFPFDPRNDGYAEKLQTLFVRDGKRFVYIPLISGNWSSALLDRQFGDLLGDIPFSAEYYGIGKPLPFFFIAYAAASLLLLIIYLFKKNVHSGAAGIISLLPVFASFAFFGAPGLAVCALFLGLFICLKEPVNELILLLGSKETEQKKNLFYKKLIEPYGMFYVFAFVFAAAIAVIVIFSQFKIYFMLLAFAASVLVFFLSVRTMSLWKSKHKRFIPVMIIKKNNPDFSFSFYMLPFAICASVIMILTPYMSGSVAQGNKFTQVIEEEDYHAHLAFQKSFSVRQLSSTGMNYPSYVLDEDGLPSPGEGQEALPAVNLNDFPPFPVGHLMDFFKNVNSDGKMKPQNTGAVVFSEFLSLILLLLFIIGGFLLMGKNIFPEKGKFDGFKRFSLKLRLTDKNRKKVLLYNRDTLRLRKDA